MTEPQIEVLDDPSAAVGELMAEAAAGGRHIVLTGGSTPRAAYEHAAGLGADWSRATFWFGDERCVPPDDPESNAHMVHEALLAPGAVEHPMPGELGPFPGAEANERGDQTARRPRRVASRRIVRSIVKSVASSRRASAR